MYTDECDVHLRHVRITWPQNFKPKSKLTPLSEKNNSSSNTTSHFVNINNSAVRCSNHINAPHLSTRKALQELVNLHQVVNFRISHGLVGTDDDYDQSKLPDMAKRHVSIRFRPANKPKKIIRRSKPHISKSNHVKLPTEHENDDQELHEPLKSGITHYERNLDLHVDHYPILSVDDEAACFNTEAFAAFSHQTDIDMDEDDFSNKRNTPVCESKTNIEEYISNHPQTDTVKWTPDEDRQLLEFCKAKGRYSSVMFKQLASIWQPKPLPNSPMRTADNLEARFKELMRITLRETYDSVLFQTPYRTESSSSDID